MSQVNATKCNATHVDDDDNGDDLVDDDDGDDLDDDDNDHQRVIMDGSLMQNFTHSVGLGHTYDEGENIDRIFGTFDSSYAGGTFAKKTYRRFEAPYSI